MAASASLPTLVSSLHAANQRVQDLKTLHTGSVSHRHSLFDFDFSRMKRGLTSVTRLKSQSTQTAFHFAEQFSPGFSSEFAKLHFAIGDFQKRGSSPR